MKVQNEIIVSCRKVNTILAKTITLGTVVKC